MDLAVKKIELINWLTRQDEEMIRKVEGLRINSLKSTYEKRMYEDLEAKLQQSEIDIKKGTVHSQADVESFFENKFKTRCGTQIFR